VLETAGVAVDEDLLGGWRARGERARAHLGWRMPGVVARRHAGGASLALAAPYDALFTATEVNEWAWCAALYARDPRQWGELEHALRAAALADAAEPTDIMPPVLEERAALQRFECLAAGEARPRLVALLEAATARGLPYVLDDTTLTLGTGAGGRDFELAELPEVASVPWGDLRDIPAAVVSGSNGKTTTVRLLAACAREHGWRTAYCCTDGIFLDAQLRVAGDYSGPAGARQVMRARDAQTAVVETARGGILRRGIALSQVQVALVTNISADHFGEYGIDDLEGLADVKLTVAGIVSGDGLLVLNADDAQLVTRAAGLARRFGRCPAFGWFALDADLTLLRAHRARGGSTCGARAGRLQLSYAGAEHDLGAIAAMPLTVEGSATYNVANLAGTALGAAALGVPPATIAMVFARFGANSADNVGRLMRFERDGVQVLLDYAHNPEGLRGLLRVAVHLRRDRGRLGLLLGHAGNRQDAEIEALARAAAEFHPELIVVKENEAQLRGRQPGEVPRIIRTALLRAGFNESVLPLRLTELDAARCALEWARPGDVLVLPVHSAAARAAVLALLRNEAGPSGPQP
jgi:UDP-N-acetylmuramyl tripeptide synthase